MNFRKVNLYLTKVEINAKNSNEILQSFKGCPYFLNGFIMSGKRNLTLFFMSEDLGTIESIVDAHIRSNPGVEDVELDVVIMPVKDFVFPVQMKFEKKSDPPCGSSSVCGECKYYKKEQCLGCPVTGFYRGSFW